MMLYIDPGTGSMLFTVIMGAVGAVVFFFRALVMKIKSTAGRDKNATVNANKYPIVIFSDHKRYWNTFESICKELDRRGQEAVFFTASSDDPALNSKFEHVRCEFIGEGNRAYSRLNLLNAYVVLATTPNLDVFQWKRSKMVDCYVHILHMVSDATMYRMFGLDYYDGILLSGDYQETQLRKLWDGRNILAKEYKVVGCTYMDSMLDRVKDIVDDNSNSDVKTVLLAPTWGPSSILSKYKSRIIDALLATDYKIIIRPHPQSFTAEKELMNQLMSQYPDGDRISWNRENDNFDCLRNADIMISDFSGVIFDFALVFDKPVIYADTQMDLGIYDAYFLDEQPWIFDILPELGKVLKEDNIENIGELIAECISSDDYKAGRDKARNMAWMHQGKAAALAADYLVEKYKELSANHEEQEKAE